MYYSYGFYVSCNRNPCECAIHFQGALSFFVKVSLFSYCNIINNPLLSVGMDSRSAFAAKGDAETAQLIHLKNEEEQIRALPPDERTEKEQSIIDRIDAFLSLVGDSLDPDEHPTPFQCPPCGSLTDDYDYETEQHLNWQHVVTLKKIRKKFVVLPNQYLSRL